MKVKFERMFFIALIATALISCKTNNTAEELNPRFNATINDSIDIEIFFNNNDQNIETVIISNTNSGIENVYGFFDDGVTPVSSERKINNNMEGVAYTYYPTGDLCSKGSYIKGKENGWHITLDELGDTIYKAYFEKGEEIKVEIESWQFKTPEIVEIKE